MTPDVRATRAVLLLLPRDGAWQARRLWPEAVVTWDESLRRLVSGAPPSWPGSRERPLVEVQGLGAGLLSMELTWRWWREAGGDPELLAPLGGSIPDAVLALEQRGLAFPREAFADEPTVGLSEVFLARAGHDWLRAHEPVAI